MCQTYCIEDVCFLLGLNDIDLYRTRELNMNTAEPSSSTNREKYRIEQGKNKWEMGITHIRMMVGEV